MHNTGCDNFSAFGSYRHHILRISILSLIIGISCLFIATSMYFNYAGFKEERDSGMGLTNIRERLQSLYGENGRLILEENEPHGLKATIEVPHGQP